MKGECGRPSLPFFHHCVHRAGVKVIQEDEDQGEEEREETVRSE